MCIVKVIHNLRDLLRESPRELQGNSEGLHAAVVVEAYSEYGPRIVFHDHADLLIRTAEIRVVNIGGNQRIRSPCVLTTCAAQNARARVRRVPSVSPASRP